MSQEKYIKPSKCPECGRVFMPKSRSGSGYRPICSDECRAKRRDARRRRVIVSCAQCGLEVVCEGSGPLRSLENANRGRAYCSESCRDAYVSARASANMTETNRRFASERMRARNPMSREDVRARVSATLRAIGHRPKTRGGNGMLTEPQKALAEALGWQCEVAVSCPRLEGRPTVYKVDVANPDSKIAIEVDGPSHSALKVKAADRRKEEFLRSCGWSVFRFSNQEVTERLADCVRTVLSTT